MTYTTSARKVRLNTSGCDSPWALTSKFRLLKLPTLLPITSVFSRSKPTRQEESLIAFWIKARNEKPILGNETAKTALLFATNCFCEASLPTLAIERSRLQPQRDFRRCLSTVWKSFKSCVKTRFTSPFCAVLLIFVFLQADFGLASNNQLKLSH